MGLLGKLIKTAVDVVVLPIAVVADVETILTEGTPTATVEAIKDVVEDVF